MVTPYLTHIVVDKIDENMYLDLLKFGNSSTIVRVDWITDSIMFGVKMDEKDYQIFSFYQK